MFNTNETCESRMTQSWNLTGMWNFSLPIGILCEIDEVVNEWATDDLLTNISHIVSTYLLFSQSKCLPDVNCLPIF